MQETDALELEQTVSKLLYALATCNAGICESLLTHLRDRFSLEEVAAVVLLCLERLLWLDAAAFVWTVEQLIPADLAQEIRRISSLILGKQLLANGFQPGQDFSLNSLGQLLMSVPAQASLFGSR